MSMQSSKMVPHICECEYTQVKQSSLTVPMSGTQSETQASICGVAISTHSQNAVQTSCARCSGGTVHADSTKTSTTNRMEKLSRAPRTVPNFFSGNGPDVPRDADAIAHDNGELARAFLVENERRAWLFGVHQFATRREPANVVRFDK